MNEWSPKRLKVVNRPLKRVNRIIRFGWAGKSYKYFYINTFATDPRYNYDQFIYDENKDKYTCPRGRKLTTNGNWYKRNTGRSTYKVKHYKTNKCQTCPARDLCTSATNGRVIERSEYAPYIEQNKRNIENDPELYKKRQAIVEYPYME